MPSSLQRKLLVWTMCDGEPMPTDPGNPRLLRMAILSEQLAKRGHDVIYWSSRFNHLRKIERDIPDGLIDCGLGYKIHYVSGLSYKSNVSIRRLIHNRIVAHRIELAMRSQNERPDVIVADLPTLELAELAGKLGKEWKTPVVLSIRDLWPDVFYTVMPGGLNRVAKMLLLGEECRAKRACKLASSLVGISNGYLDWALSKANRKRLTNDDIIPLGYPENKPLSSQVEEKNRKRLEKLGVRFDRKLLCFVGTFGQSYDLETVINAAKIMEDRNDFQFVLCGDGEKGREWRKQAIGVSNIVFTGWINQAEIKTLLDSSYVGLAAYCSEVKQGLPNKFFEYMSYGLPIISSLRGEAKTEINAHNFGDYYAPMQPTKLRDALNNVLDNHNLHSQMRSAALDRYNSVYRQSIVYTKYCDLVEKNAAMKPSNT